MPLNERKQIPLGNFIDMLSVVDPSSTDVDLEFLNQMMELKKQKEQMAQDVADFGGVSELKGVDLTASKGLDDEMLAGLMWGSVGGGIPKVARKGFQDVISRVSNLTEPILYENKLPSLFARFKANPKEAMNAIIKDVPLYDMSKKAYINRSMNINVARELPFRKMLGKEPRIGGDIYRKVKDGTYTFNKSNKEGKALADQAMEKIKMMSEHKLGYPKGVAVGHDVMGGFNFKNLPKGKVEYKDVWDFVINPQGKKKYLSALNRTAKSMGDVRDKNVLLEALQRMIMNAVTDPITIVGRGKL